MAIKRFKLDKRNGKFLGVCSGIANYFGWDVTFVRIGAVVVTLLGAAPWTFVAYALAGWLAKDKGLSDPTANTGSQRFSTKDFHLNMRDIDRRMAEVETYVTSSNGSLAREIEELR